MVELHLTSVSIFHNMICPLKFASKDIVCGGGDTGGSEQHVCKVILVIRLSLSEAEQKLEIGNRQWRSVMAAQINHFMFKMTQSKYSLLVYQCWNR